jgi:hypothetical protein
MAAIGLGNINPKYIGRTQNSSCDRPSQIRRRPTPRARRSTRDLRRLIAGNPERWIWWDSRRGGAIRRRYCVSCLISQVVYPYVELPSLDETKRLESLQMPSLNRFRIKTPTRPPRNEKEALINEIRGIFDQDIGFTMMLGIIKNKGLVCVREVF